MKVKVVKVSGKYLVLRWIDPETGFARQKSAKTKDHRQAERQAAKLEAEVAEGRYFAPSNISWVCFREAFEAERMPTFAPGTRICYDALFNRVQLLLKPQKLAELNSVAVSRFQKLLRDFGNSETTICKHLRHLKAALRWAKSMGMITRVPDFHFPKSGRHQTMMKGRPITDEEFKRMLEAAEAVVGIEAAPSWKFLLEGLWWSGLRLGEALNLTWHPSETLFVKFEGEYPMFCIRAEAEKGRKDRLLPMAPEFVRFLESNGRQNNGLVFVPLSGPKLAPCERINWVSKIGSRIGLKSGVVVKQMATRPSEAKCVSLHDLRRSFGDRWSRRVMPQVLMCLMRHESIETTLRYYVSSDANRMAADLWKLGSERELHEKNNE